MEVRTRGLWELIIDFLALAGLLVIAFAAAPSRAAINACIEDGDGNRLRRVYVQHWLTDYRTNAAGCVVINTNDTVIDIRVFAQNPVIRMDDGGNFGIAVSQEIHGVRNGDTVAIGAQQQWFTTAERFRRAYNDGLRNLAPWNGAEFPAAVMRNPGMNEYFIGRGMLRSVWPDAGPAVRAWTEAMAPVLTGDLIPGLTAFPLIHLKDGDEDAGSIIAHELGHALHFARLDDTTSSLLEGSYGIFLATDASRAHCFARRTNPTVAWIEAFGIFAEDFAASAGDEQDFFDRAIAQRRALFGAEQCDTPANTEDGPMLGADVEGAVYLALFHDFARNPNVGLDFVVETFIDCQSLDIAGYAQCIEDRHGASSTIYKALLRAASCYGISIDGSVAALLGAAEVADSFGRAVASGDFNGDGFADLAIGTPFEDSNSIDAVGAVHVLYGRPDGLSAACSAELVQGSNGMPDAAEAGDHFGATLATGDFDGDRIDDLAIAAPDEDVNDVELAGLVIVVPGSNRGLEPDRATDWHLDKAGVVGTATANDGFGLGLATGDFNGDGADDLAVGVPDSDVPATKGTPIRTGSVNVLYGTLDVGITVDGAQRLVQPETVESFDRFGRALAAGDFDCNGFDDLAVGAPGEDVGTIAGAGAVSVFYGGITPGTTLSPTASRHWTQDTSGIAGLATFGESFGETLASGDFDADAGHCADLAIAVPSDKVGTVEYAGSVAVFYGNTSRTATPRNDLWTQDTGTVQDFAETSEHFGASLATGDFDEDGHDDLAIGVPHQRIGNLLDGGAVAVLYGAAAHDEPQTYFLNGQPHAMNVVVLAGLDDANNDFWSQNTGSVEGTAQANDEFAKSLAAGDFNGDGDADLAIGVPNDGDAASGSGAVQVLRGVQTTGLTTSGDQYWDQDR